MSEPGFWDDQARAQKISTEHARTSEKLEMYERLTRDYEDARDLYELDPGMEEELEFHAWQDVQRIGPFMIRTARMVHPVPAYAIRVEHEDEGAPPADFSSSTRAVTARATL